MRYRMSSDDPGVRTMTDGTRSDDLGVRTIVQCSTYIVWAMGNQPGLL